MKKILLLILPVVLTTGIVTIQSMTRTDVANAQLSIDFGLSNSTCPTNSVCIWSERNFTGTRSISPVKNIVAGLCFLNKDNNLNTIIGRSIRNNTPCIVDLYVQRVARNNLVTGEIPANSQLADTGEFRTISEVGRDPADPIVDDPSLDE